MVGTVSMLEGSWFLVMVGFMFYVPFKNEILFYVLRALQERDKKIIQSRT